MLSLSLESSAFRPMRDHKFDVSVSIGTGCPDRASNDFSDGYLSWWDRNSGKVEALYGGYMGDVKYSGVYSVRFEYKPLKWLSAGADVSFMNLWAKTSSGMDKTQKTKNGYVTYVMPQARFYYFRTKLSTLSSAVSAGVGVHGNCGREGDTRAKLDCQVYLLSYTFGDKLYGRVEWSAGTIVSSGLHFGIGYRF